LCEECGEYKRVVVVERLWSRTQRTLVEIMENRRKISVSGVEDIESFNEEQIILYTCNGVLIISGSGMHISKLSIDNGETTINGEFNSLIYNDTYGKKDKSGILARLFR
jgi:sporulation protein YabP